MDWREWQANRGMGALLMPRRIFNTLAIQRMNAHKVATLVVGSATADAITADLADLFQVSKKAAAIRLQTLGLAHPAHSSGELTLF